MSKQNSGTFGLFCLIPNEILVECLSFCESQELINTVRLISKGFLQFVLKNNILWKIVLRNEYQIESELYPSRKSDFVYDKFLEYLFRLRQPKNIKKEITRVENDDTYVFEVLDEYGQALLNRNRVINNFLYTASWDGSLLRLLIHSSECANRSEFSTELSLRLILNSSAIDYTVPLSKQFESILQIFKTGEYSIEFKSISSQLDDYTKTFFQEPKSQSYQNYKYQEMIGVCGDNNNGGTIYGDDDLLISEKSRRAILFFATQDEKKLDKSRIEYYEKMINSKRFPILLLFQIRGCNYILDGHHKFSAYRNVNKYPLHAVIIKYISPKKTIFEVIGSQNMTISQYFFYCLENIGYESVMNSESISEKELQIFEKYDSDDKTSQKKYIRARNEHLRTFLTTFEEKRKNREEEEEIAPEDPFLVIEMKKDVTVKEFKEFLDTKLTTMIDAKVNENNSKEEEEEQDNMIQPSRFYSVRYRDCLVYMTSIGLYIYCESMREKWKRYTNLWMFHDEKNFNHSFLELCFRSTGFYPKKHQEFTHVMIPININVIVVVKFRL